jgi:hypothetical protein
MRDARDLIADLTRSMCRYYASLTRLPFLGVFSQMN